MHWILIYWLMSQRESMATATAAFGTESDCNHAIEALKTAQPENPYLYEFRAVCVPSDSR